MPKKTTTKKKTTETAEGAVAEPMVTILKTAQAEKLSPRGDGRITYQVGRMGDTVLLRISGNESSGRFSKEWVAADAIRQSLAKLPKDAKSFKGALALKTAWKGQSSCNSGFGAAILKAEGVFVGDADPKKKGMLALSAPDALDAWEKTVLDLKVPKDAETVLLDPPKPKPFFAKKEDGDAEHDATDPVEPAEDTTDEAEIEETTPEEAEA